MIAYFILAIFVIFAVLSLKYSRNKTVKGEINVKNILAHAPKDEDKMQK